MRNNRTWCGPCQRIAPTYHALAEEYSEQAIFVVRAAASQQRSTRVLLLRVDTKSPPCTAPHPVPSRASMLMSLASLLPSLECPACPRSCSSGGLWLPRESNSACSWQRDDQTHVSQLLCPGGPCAPPNNSCHITHAVAFSPVVAQPLAAAMARSSIRCEAPTSKACATWSHLWPQLDHRLIIYHRNDPRCCGERARPRCAVGLRSDLCFRRAVHQAWRWCVHGKD
jgi:hypothetical protein